MGKKKGGCGCGKKRIQPDKKTVSEQRNQSIQK